MLTQFAKRGIRKIAAAIGPHRWPAATPRLWILTYHRVLPADDVRTALEEPGMVVTPETFRRHIEWLKRRFEIVSLGRWAADAESGAPLPKRACAITFDDGWRDNDEFAFPVLKEQQAPATIFVVADLIGTERRFWPNRLASLLAELGTRVNELEEAQWLRDLGYRMPETGPNREEYSRAIAHCKQVPDDELAARLDETESGLDIGRPTGRDLLDWPELRAMMDSGLIEVGSHTCSHRRLLPQTPDAVLETEIVGSQEKLQSKLGMPIRTFCYPNGDFTQDAESLVRNHYSAAVTTRGGINAASTNLYELKRIGLHEDTAASKAGFMARLSGWV